MQTSVDMACAEREPSGETETVSPILTTSELTAGYGSRTVVDRVSLSLGAGEILTLIGANGAGKSTLLKALIGLVPVKSGSVVFGSTAIHEWPAHRRARIGLAYLMQGGAVFPTLTVRANLAAATADLPPEAAAAGIAEVLRLFEMLEEWQDRRAGLLSGGERQLLALAMLFARGPKVALLDEPSAGLSPRLVEVVLAKVVLVCRTQKTAVLLVEQNVRSALAVAHRAAVMERGKVVVETPEPLSWLSNGALEDVLWDRSAADGSPR